MKRYDVLRLSLGFLVSGLLLSLSIHLLQEARPPRDQAGVMLPPLALLPTPLIEVVTLGHRPLYDDLVYLWLLQVLTPQASEAVLPTASLLSSITLALDHKPRIEAIYLLSCFVVGLERQRADLCEPWLQSALSMFPHSWRLLMSLAYLYAFPLQKPLYAAAYYHLAADHQRSPPYVRRLATKMLQKASWSTAEEAELLQVILKLPAGASFQSLLRDHSQLPVIPTPTNHR